MFPDLRNYFGGVQCQHNRWEIDLNYENYVFPFTIYTSSLFLSSPHSPTPSISCSDYLCICEHVSHTVCVCVCMCVCLCVCVCVCVAGLKLWLERPMNRGSCGEEMDGCEPTAVSSNCKILVTLDSCLWLMELIWRLPSLGLPLSSGGRGGGGRTADPGWRGRGGEREKGHRGRGGGVKQGGQRLM